MSILNEIFGRNFYEQFNYNKKNRYCVTFYGSDVRCDNDYQNPVAFERLYESWRLRCVVVGMDVVALVWLFCRRLGFGIG